MESCVICPHIYTDGGYHQGKGIGGWAYVVTFGGEILETGTGKETNTSSFRMELRALREGLKRAEGSGVIYTDCLFLVQACRSQLPTWAKNDWRKHRGGRVKNCDLWMEVWESVEKHGMPQIKWVKGHSGNVFNEYADGLVRSHY